MTRGDGAAGTTQVVLVLPITPAPTGNGLAMRAGSLLDALADATAVHVVIVPVAGRAIDHAWAASRAASVHFLEPILGEQARDHATQQLADAGLRMRLEHTAPVPARAAAAPPTLAPLITDLLPDSARDSATVVLAMRLYLAPLGVQLGHTLRAARLLLDADDDDAAALHGLGQHDEADAYERLARCWLPDYDEIFAASAVDADGLAARSGVRPINVLPNTVASPGDVCPPPGKDRLLFLGNLTYEPNRIAAERLAREILPLVRARRPAATLELVGEHGGRLSALARCDGVILTGAVPDVGPHYERADVVVVPLEHGAGTRIKVLEAFAHRRPVVATPTSTAGLGVEADAIVTATSDAQLAAAVDRVLADDEQTAARVDRAADWVAKHHSKTAIAATLRDAVLRGSRRTHRHAEKEGSDER